jgi:transcriptional regulator with GAF, ATPase, and Fis domain
MQVSSEPVPVIVGQSEKTRQVLRNIDKVARGRWPVLILGETGTGKEVVARSVYHASRTDHSSLSTAQAWSAP